jgi:hypothetical protein
MMTNQAVIIIPFYKNELDYGELFSLSRCFDVLGGDYHIVGVKPASLDLSTFEKRFSFSDVISFPDKYFNGIAGYNELMLSTMFYQEFLSYKYMLIYQLDAFVFSNDLNNWCNKGFQYIGAPWLHANDQANLFTNMAAAAKGYLYRRYNKQANGVMKPKQLFNQVGNGGFSLRSVQAFHTLSIKHRELADEYVARLEPEYNEDIFWSIALNRKKKNLSIPNFNVAAKFSIETRPEIAFKLNQNKLPFGCHAWDKNLSFWHPILVRYGYAL